MDLLGKLNHHPAHEAFSSTITPTSASAEERHYTEVSTFSQNDPNRITADSFDTRRFAKSIVHFDDSRGADEANILFTSIEMIETSD